LFLWVVTDEISALNIHMLGKIGADSSITLAKFRIRNILFAGNEKTEEDVILRELKTRENAPFDEKLLKEDIQRLNNLGLFTKIDIYPVPTDSMNVVDMMFVFEESLYIIPLPQGGFRNGQLSEFWAGLNLIWRNFRGRNETVSASFGIGSDPFANLSYSIPWIGKKAHFFSSFSAGYSNNKNKSLQTVTTTGNEIPDKEENYSIKNFKASISLGKFLSREFSVTGILRFNLLETSQYEPGRTVSPDGKDEFGTFSVNGRYDTRNSFEYTTSGTLLFLDYSKAGFGGLIDFNRVGIDVRKFIPIKLSENYAISIGLSTIGSIAFGAEIPTYMREFFGYDKVIRGHKKLVYEGENRLGSFNEIRFPLINETYFKGGDIPAVNKISMLKKMSYRFALYATVFFDVGTVWNKNSNFFNAKYHNGFGAGLNYILPFGLVGRTDFAFRKEGKKFVPQVIFDLSSAF
jgi:outer membrane protein insertion porin family